MAKVRSPQTFSLLYQVIIGWGVIGLGSLFLAATICTLVGMVLGPIEAWLLQMGVPFWLPALAALIGPIAVWLVCVFLLIRLVLVPSAPLPVFLYLRMELQVPVKWQDARSTSFLFKENSVEHWPQLRALSKLPEELRRKAFFEFVDRVTQDQFEFESEAPKQESQSFRTETGRSRKDEDYAPPPNYQSTRPPPPPRRLDPASGRALQALGLQHGATKDQIKEAYRSLVKKHHPDVFAKNDPKLIAEAEERMKQINSAYTHLTRWMAA